MTVYVTVSNDGVPIYGVDGTPMAHLQVEVPYFDLESQGLAEFYRYHTENGQGGGSYIDNGVVERPTVLHLYLTTEEEFRWICIRKAFPQHGWSIRPFMQGENLMIQHIRPVEDFMESDLQS